MNERSYDIQDVRYHILSNGDEQNGVPLLLLHGFTGSAANWLPLMEMLGRNRRVIAVDLLGHGGTDSPDDPARYRIERAAADLIDILDLLDIVQVDLLGYSMGGRLALACAVEYPLRIRSLILESASPGLATSAEREARRQSDCALADCIEKKGVSAFIDYWESIPLFASQMNLPHEARAQLRAQRLTNNPRGLANSLRGMGTGAQPNYWDTLRHLVMPILLITGALDTKFSKIGMDMHTAINRSRLHIVPGAGHTVHLEQPRLFGELTRDFLNAMP